MEAASRRAERESQRQYHRLQLDERQRAKMEARQQAACENQIERLLSVHKESPEAWDWNGIYNSSPPVAPERASLRETNALAKLSSFNPGFLDKLLGRVEPKRQSLEQAVEAARAQD
jgi:hypothetical protein